MEVILSNKDVEISVSRAEGFKCVRCRLASKTVGTFADAPELCDRCHEILEVMDKSGETEDKMNERTKDEVIEDLKNENAKLRSFLTIKTIKEFVPGYTYICVDELEQNYMEIKNRAVAFALEFGEKNNPVRVDYVARLVSKKEFQLIYDKEEIEMIRRETLKKAYDLEFLKRIENGETK